MTSISKERRVPVRIISADCGAALGVSMSVLVRRRRA